MGQKRLPNGALRTDELDAFIVLEIVTSLMNSNDLNDYWCSKLFFGNEEFKRVIGRDLFLKIRSSLKLYPTYNNDTTFLDPLLHS